MDGIATQRLRLVPLDRFTADAILEGRRPAGANWAPGYPADSTLVAAAIVITAESEGRDLGPWTVYQVVRAADDRVVAGIGFLEPPGLDGVAHIGFSETAEARAEQLLPEAIAGLTAWAVEQPGVSAVRADTGTANTRAIAVLEAAGMRRVGADQRLVYYEA